MARTTKGRMPVWPIVAAAHRATFDNIGYAIRICWAWFLVCAVAVVWLDLWLIDPLPIEPWTTVDIVSVSLVSSLAVSSAAVAWHRKLLLGESFTGSLLPIGAAYLRLDTTVWHYFGFALLIVLMTIGLPMSLMTPALFLPSKAETLIEELSLLMFLLGLLGLVVGVIFATRLGVVFPGIVVGMKRASLKNTWRLTRANTLRLAFGGLLCSWPYVILYVALWWLGIDPYRPNQAVAERLLGRLAEVGVYLLAGLIWLTFLTFSFRFFFCPETKHAEQTEDTRD